MRFSHIEKIYLGYHGQRGNFASNNIHERLDRGVANPSWYNLFPNYRLTHLNSPCSDHLLILLDK
ncbi:non-ltr retroelement reverse transcriptase [Gossypium australe]|uniref:Non-ltr retroelement reverse transcriptase n=1 Tax=Gossypium australe TaxID=47621 RepID=A0A5B6VVH0_9ROSI|nr:non-ltr retroelement reverse transcriptase [Gossypium australe]